MQKTSAVLLVAALAVVLLTAACRAGAPSYDDASAEEIFAAAEAAVGKVDSFAYVHEWTWGGTEMVTTTNELQDERNYRKTRSAYSRGVLIVGPSEVAVVDGETFWNSADTWSDSPPTYALPANLSNLQRLGDETPDGARVYHLQGTQPSSTPASSEVEVSTWTIDLFIDAETLLLVRSEGRTTITYFPPQGDSSEGRDHEGLAVATYGRFGEDFDIVPPGPTPTPAADPTPTPR